MDTRFFLLVAGAGVIAALCGCSRPRAESAGELRVVSLAPNLTEMICALGAADCLVGRTSACDYPPEAIAKVPVIGGFGAPSVERLISVNPTLVVEVDLADDTTGRAIDKLGIRRERILCRTLDDIPAALLTLGQYLGREKEARRIADPLTAEITRLRTEAAAATSPPAVFAEIWGDPSMTAGANSFISELITLAGGRNIGDEGRKDYYQVSSEWVVSCSPDVVLCLYPSEPGEARWRVLERAGWANVNAVRTGRVYDHLSCNIILRPGPRVLDGIAELRRAIQSVPRQQ